MLQGLNGNTTALTAIHPNNCIWRWFSGEKKRKIFRQSKECLKNRLKLWNEFPLKIFSFIFTSKYFIQLNFVSPWTHVFTQLNNSKQRNIFSRTIPTYSMPFCSCCIQREKKYSKKNHYPNYCATDKNTDDILFGKTIKLWANMFERENLTTLKPHMTTSNR